MQQNEFNPSEITALVADSHDLIRKTVSRALIRLGIGQTFELSSVEECKKLLASQKIDLVISDLRIGQGSGFDLLDHIRNSEVESDIPVIIVTGEADKDDIVKASGLGASDYILKPFPPEDLEAKIRKVLTAFYNPTDNQLVVREIEGLLRAKKIDAALKAVSHNQEKHKGSPSFVHISALATAKAGNRDEAIDLLNENINKHSTFLKSYNSLATLLFANGDRTQAMDVMARELELNPKQIHRQIQLADLLLKDNKPKEAISHYRAALIDSNRNPEALLGMGHAYGMMKNLEKCIYYFRRMRRHHPKNSRPLEAMLSYGIKLNNLKSVEFAFRDEKKQHPERVDTYVFLAKLYLRRGENEEAKSCLIEAIKPVKNSSAHLMALAQIIYDDGDLEDVSKQFNELYEETKVLGIFAAEAKFLMKFKKYSKALALMHKAAPALISDLNSLNRVALATLGTKQYAKAYFINLAIQRHIEEAKISHRPEAGFMPSSTKIDAKKLWDDRRNSRVKSADQKAS